MLILADADGFRIDFHQFRQRILQTTGDRDRAAQGDVEIWKLLRRQLRSGIHGRPRFADDHFLRRHVRELFLYVEIEAFGFTRGRTVANRDQFDVVFFAQRGDHGSRFGRLTGMRINGIRRHQLAGAVNDSDFYAGTQARIKAHRGAQACGGCHQQVVQVTGKHVNRFIFRTFAHGAHQFGFEVH